MFILILVYYLISIIKTRNKVEEIFQESRGEAAGEKHYSNDEDGGK